MLPSYRAAARRRRRSRGVRDTFTRADSAVSLGVADTGQAWSSDVGTWGLSGGKATNVSATDGDLASLDAGRGDGTYSLDVTATAFALAGGGVTLRGLDVNNHLLADVTAGAVRLLKRDAGAYSVLSSTPLALTDGATYTVSVVAAGATHAVSVNGALRLTYTLTAPEQAKYLAAGYTRAGIRNAGTSAGRTFDNLSAT